ncbi:MAG: class I SAM-dependent methyltransferase [Clostridiales bacterium]|nr:class I SAM-dependent methyltransferase [Clostridiales bacterium]
MNDYSERYDLKPAAAWLRGHALRTGVPNIDKELLDMPLEVLTDAELSAIVEAGERTGQKLYPFKTGKTELPRVRRVLSFLHGIEFETLLDVGSGRGVFLLPFMEEFPQVQVTSLELLDKRVAFLNELAAGGYSQLTAYNKNICDQPFPENSFDVVTLLEVLEHIPEVEKAVAAAVKMARKYVVVSVPSKEDDNPEHIHLLTKDILTKLFADAGCTKLHFGGINGHLILVANVEESQKEE